MSKNFHLTNMEKKFFDNHKNYDVCQNIYFITRSILSGYFPKEDWRVALKKYISEGGQQDPQSINQMLMNNVPITVEMKNFYDELHKNKSAPFPSKALDAMLS